ISVALLLFFCGADQLTHAADPSSAQKLFSLKGHRDYVLSVAFSADGKQLASGSQDKTIRVWEAVTGKEVRTLMGHTAAVRSVAFSPDGKQLASGSLDETLKLWVVATGEA